MEPRRNTETDGSSGRPVMSDEPNESSAKSVLTEVTRSNKRVLRESIIGDEEMDATLKPQVFFNTTGGSSGRPVMSDEPSESSAKSVLTEVTRSNKSVLRGSIIGDEEMDATLKSEVFFNTTDGNLSGLRETSFPVPSASKKWKNSVELYSEPACYTFMEVMAITDNFGKKIEENGFWTMYHGKLQTGQEVAVKVCGKYEKCCEHIVKVIGYCEEGDHQISIYEYMPRGTLQQHLHDKGGLDSETHALDGKTRLQIALHIAQGLQHIPALCFKLGSHDIFLTENWVPKIRFDHLNSGMLGFMALPVSTWEWLAIYTFGFFLWELISGQPEAKYEKLSHLVKYILEDSGNMGNINPNLGSNFAKKTIMKIVRIIHFCLQPIHVLQPTMSDVIDEINGALQLEEGLKAEEGAMKIEIPRSSKGDSICSSSDDEMPSTSKKESLSPQPELFGTITSIEGVPNLPTMRRSSVMVASRKNSEGNVELLFKDAENMTQVVGVGLEWAKVVVTKELDVEVREIGEHAWKGLWEDQGCEELELLEIILPEPETKVGGSLNTGLEDELERFGIGLTKSDVIGVYAENHLEQLNEVFFPLVYDLVEYMGLEGENSIRCKQVSGGEGGSSKGAAKVRCSTENSRGKKNVHGDPS
ncbi:hypothetical protein CY35_08G114900 [Sphagnum magellanicum]|nr:hypothetical protein CY35_08G114900 [Sphagnum magellanicum]